MREVPGHDELRWWPWSSSTKLVAFLFAVCMPPLLCEFWYVWWRWRRPSAAKLAALRRSRAVRHALDALARSDSADRIAQITTRFLHERVGLPTSAATALEIAAHLEAVRMAPTILEQAKVFFQRCDAARFGPQRDSGEELRTDAERLILAVEEST
jgi:hypothetical protein